MKSDAACVVSSLKIIFILPLVELQHQSHIPPLDKAGGPLGSSEHRDERWEGRNRSQPEQQISKFYCCGLIYRFIC